MRSSVTSTRSKVKVKDTELPKLQNCTFLGLSPLPFCPGAQHSWLVVIVWTWSTAFRSLIFEFSSRKGIMRVQTSRNVDISRNSNGHFSVVRDATVTWLDC